MLGRRRCEAGGADCKRGQGWVDRHCKRSSLPRWADYSVGCQWPALRLRCLAQVDPLARKPKDSQLLEEYQRLVAEERECIQAIRDSEREWKVTMEVRGGIPGLVLSQGLHTWNLS